MRCLDMEVGAGLQGKTLDQQNCNHLESMFSLLIIAFDIGKAQIQRGKQRDAVQSVLSIITFQFQRICRRGP